VRSSAGDLDTLQSVETTATGEKISANENKRAVAVSGPTPEA
jgi:hypothetical protein